MKNTAMERGHDAASRQGVLAPVSYTCDVFDRSILAPLQSSYLYGQSQQSFTYTSAFLIKNARLEEKYNAFRVKRRQERYSDEDLKETYGFLLFDDANKASALGETGVLTGNSTCSTLGDPCKGVYISMYSDCLDLNSWYHGKSGYIAVIRLTKGRVKKVLENYTPTFTVPTVGFDCHVSEELPSVSDKTSSFLAFERTQYYMYELLGDGGETAQSPGAACPFAIVSFSYTDTKATIKTPPETSEEKRLMSHYLAWRGQLQIGTQYYDVGLRSTVGALIPAKLPPVVKIGRVISMTDLLQLLPRTVFETRFSGEVFLGGFYCSLCELVSSEAEGTNSISLLLREIKEKDLALPVPLNDGGFLVLLHFSHFLKFDETSSDDTEVLQGMFIFPDSRVVQKAMKSGQRKATIPSEILRVLPALHYAEDVGVKRPLDPNEELCEALAQNMLSYAALVDPGLEFGPAKEVCIHPDKYDVPDAHKHLYSSSKWTSEAWQSFRSYVGKPVSFQLPVSKASEILAARREELREDLDDDVYICVSSPEEASANSVGTGSEAQLTDQRCPVNVATSVDSCMTCTEAQVDLMAVPQSVEPDATKDNEKSDLSVLHMGARDPMTPPTSEDLSARLIVSITTAEHTVSDDSFNVMSASKHDNFGISIDKLQIAGVNCLHDEPVQISGEEVTNFRKKRRKLHRGHSKVLKRPSRACAETRSLQQVKIEEKDNIPMGQAGNQSKESPGDLKWKRALNTNWRKLRKRKCQFVNISSKIKKTRSGCIGLALAEETKGPGQSLEGFISTEPVMFPLRKKTERWDLRPVISECGRILVPHGSVDFAGHIQSLMDTHACTKAEHNPVKMDAYEDVQMEPESSTDTAVDETDAATSKDRGNHRGSVGASLDNEQFQSRHLDNGSLPLNPEDRKQSSENDGMGTPHSEEKKPCAAKGAILLQKLKTVLLRVKGKNKFCVSEGTISETDQNTEPCSKKGKSDLDSAVTSQNAISSVRDANVGAKDVSKMPSVDPVFAYALGLTPIEKPDEVLKSEGIGSQQRVNSSETQALTILNKPTSPIVQRAPSALPRGTRVKTLKKQQGICSEYVKKKWWLHFQSPASYDTENHKECTSDILVRKTVKGKGNNACSSTDALNLLADLALITASNDLVPAQPTFDRKPDTRLKEHGVKKDVTSAAQESVLHTLLRQPAARPIGLLEPSSSSQLLGESEVVGLISREHAYSFLSSSSPLLDLPGTPFQVSPLSGSTRLLHHPQQLYGNGIQTVQPPVRGKNRGERGHNTRELPKKHVSRRHKFRQSRTFVDKDGTVKVTRQWKENYDFNGDGKFASDRKGKAIIRALHGPWDSSIQDHSEEVRLIVHMWIGLFYSRSTARFFDIDANFTNSCSEEDYSLEISSGTVSAPAQSDPIGNSYPALTGTKDTEDPFVSKASDLVKKDNVVLDQGPFVLDLSQKKSGAESVASGTLVKGKDATVSDVLKEASEMLKSINSSVGLQEANTLQCHKTTVHPYDIGSHHEVDKTGRPSPKVGCWKRIDMTSLKGAGFLIPPGEEIQSVSVWTGDFPTASEIGHILHGYNNKRTQIKYDNSKLKEMSFDQKHATDPDQSMTMSSKETDGVIHTDESDDIQSKLGENWKKKVKCLQRNLDPVIDLISDDSADKMSSVICNGNKNIGEPEATPVHAENTFEDVDSWSVRDGKMNAGEDNIGRDGLDETGGSMEGYDSDSSDRPLVIVCDSHDSTDEDCLTEISCQAPLHEKSHQADVKEDSCRTPPHIPNFVEPVNKEPMVEENSGKDICSTDKAHCQNTVLPLSDENTCSLNGPCEAESVPQTKNRVDSGSKNAVVLVDVALNSDDGEYVEIKSFLIKGKNDNLTQEESLSEVIEKRDKVLTMDTDLKVNETSEKLGISPIEVVIPGRNYVNISPPPCEMVSYVQKVIPLISETQDLDWCITSNMYSKNEEPFAEDVSLLDVGETKLPSVFGSESDERCSIPTFDEKQQPNSGSGSSTAETCKNVTPGFLDISSTPLKNETTPVVQNNCNTTRGYGDPVPHCDPDVELRSQRVLQSIGKFYPESPNHTNSSCTIVRDDTENCLDENPNRSMKYMDIGFQQSKTSSRLKNKKTSYLEPSVLPASTSQELHKDSSDHFLISPFTLKLEEVLGSTLQLNKTNSPAPQHSSESTDRLQSTYVKEDYSQSYRAVPSTETIKPNIAQEGNKPSPPTSSHEPCSNSQRPVMAVKPSKSDECQAASIHKEEHIEDPPKSKQDKTLTVTSTSPSTENTGGFMGNFGSNDIKHESSEFFSKRSQLSAVNEGTSYLEKVNIAPVDPSHQYQEGDTRFTSFETAESNGDQDSKAYSLLGKCGQTTKGNAEMDFKDCSDASTSLVEYTDGRMEDSLSQIRQTSLMCTVFNTSEKRPSSFLEQVSQRCLHDEPTQASMEQECLIFSEQMKQLLKRSKSGPISQQDARDKFSESCASPVIVHFSSLGEQDDSPELWDTPSLAEYKIKVDMSDREEMADSTKQENKICPGRDNLKEQSEVSGVTSKCARLYEAMMDDVCAVREVPSKPKHFGVNKSPKKIEPSSLFDFCHQMKQEVDESFQSNLNSVVKKSCKTKYRFYILVTLEDDLFEETKAELESVGHTAIEPPEFFLGEGGSSSLLIILRNEDIAEHYCEVPHLLELKKTPGVQFAGIDEPDDVVNLTHQELFVRGGFIMFDRAALEALSLCNLKKCSDILHELSRKGKWKWMLHYRDSRWMKENARTSAEAKEKKCFLNSCQDVGMLEVLPYHECDLMSRDQPDYLTCLVRLQVQNVSARFPVFITDASADSDFGRNGILTMTANSFLTNSPSETFTFLT